MFPKLKILLLNLIYFMFKCFLSFLYYPVAQGTNCNTLSLIVRVGKSFFVSDHEVLYLLLALIKLCQVNSLAHE